MGFIKLLIRNCEKGKLRKSVNGLSRRIVKSMKCRMQPEQRGKLREKAEKGWKNRKEFSENFKSYLTYQKLVN